MADFDTAWDKDGKLSAENVKAALEKVLKDVPALKPDRAEQAGFQIGSGRDGGSREGAVKTVSHRKDGTGLTSKQNKRKEQVNKCQI